MHQKEPLPVDFAVLGGVLTEKEGAVYINLMLALARHHQVHRRRTSLYIPCRELLNIARKAQWETER
jgi:hypothetical protein